MIAEESLYILSEPKAKTTMLIDCKFRVVRKGGVPHLGCLCPIP